MTTAKSNMPNSMNMLVGNCFFVVLMRVFALCLIKYKTYFSVIFYLLLMGMLFYRNYMVSICVYIGLSTLKNNAFWKDVLNYIETIDNKHKILKKK